MHKKKAMADHPFQPKLVNQDRGSVPSYMTGFKDRKLATCLNWASILLEDYDACCRFSDEEYKNWIAHYCY